MSKIEDGGPAFPRDGYVNEYGNLIDLEPGMSLRDWFAGRAVDSVYCELRGVFETEDAHVKAVAAEAYAVADAMIAARKTGGE
jgi:hypothetical protein